MKKLPINKYKIICCILIILITSCRDINQVVVEFEVEREQIESVMTEICLELKNNGFIGKTTKNNSKCWNNSTDYKPWSYYVFMSYQENKNIQVTIRYRASKSVVEMLFSETSDRRQKELSGLAKKILLTLETSLKKITIAEKERKGLPKDT